MKRCAFGHLRRAATTVAVVLAASLCGCGDHAEPGDKGNDAPPPPGSPTITTTSPDAPPLPGETECKVVVQTGIRVDSALHVPACTPVAYATNPPSGGDHWAVWAAYKAYEAPVPREMYVHNLEHGAIVLAYRCPSGCAEVTAMLEEVLAEANPDPRCLTTAGGPAARLVLTPDDELDTPVAAAAWGATYAATCLDKPSLERFVAEHYARGPEDTCSNGKDVDDPASGAPRCEDVPADAGAPDASR